jgi:arabinofuranosyltransferase
MKANRAILALLIIASIIVFFRTAWLSDDAFITLRVVDNWVHGYGLTFNPSERVQVYTHPLWMFAMTLMYLIVHNGYFTILLLSLIVSVTVIVLFFKTSDDISFVCFGWAALMLSKAFMDFSTSGLENPATHLFIILFVNLYFKADPSLSRSRLFTLSLLAGLATLNRMDSLLLFLPALIYITVKGHPSPDTSLGARLKLVAAGFVPFLLWELFALFYYGFLFPNTYYAKLHTGIPQAWMFNQGILYFLNSISWDPITLIVIFTGIIFAFLQPEVKPRLIASGIAFYLFYIVYIGGDFMTGRFFSAVFFASAILLVHFFSQFTTQQKYLLASIIFLFGVLSPRGTVATFLNRNDKVMFDEVNGISDERETYFEGTSLMTMNRAFDMPQSSQSTWGISYRGTDKRVAIVGGIGLPGYYGGPNLKIVDIFALADPLLARLPVKNPYTRIGHFERDLPKGYVETIESGRNQIANPHLAEFYEKMKLITTGDLFLPGRLKTIWEMNTGQYDYLIQKATE